MVRSSRIIFKISKTLIHLNLTPSKVNFSGIARLVQKLLFNTVTSYKFAQLLSPLEVPLLLEIKIKIRKWNHLNYLRVIIINGC